MNKVSRITDRDVYGFMMELDHDIINLESRRGSNYYAELLVTVTEEDVTGEPDLVPYIGLWLSDTAILDHDEGMCDEPSCFFRVQERTREETVTYYARIQE